ncbi:MAG: hypothetical protein WDW36_000047 [Sanguina aurantia]
MSDVAQTNTRNACDRSTEQPGLKQPLISAAGGGSQQHSRFTAPGASPSQSAGHICARPTSLLHVQLSTHTATANAWASLSTSSHSLTINNRPTITYVPLPESPHDQYDSPPTNYIQLIGALSKAKDLAKLQKLVDEYQDKFEAVHVCAAIAKLPKLIYYRSGDIVDRSDSVVAPIHGVPRFVPVHGARVRDNHVVLGAALAAQLDAMLPKFVGACYPRQVANMVWAFGELAKKGVLAQPSSLPHLLLQIKKGNYQQLDIHGTGVDLAQLLKGLGHLQTQRDDPGLISALASFTRRHSNKLGPRDVPMVAWGFAKLGHREHTLYQALSEAATRHSLSLAPHSIAIMFWALSRAGYTDAALFGRLAAGLRAQLVLVVPQDIAMVTHAAARLGYVDKGLMDMLARKAVRVLDRFEDIGIANTLEAYTRLGLKQPALFAAVANNILAEDKVQASASVLSKVLFSYAAGTHDPAILELFQRLLAAFHGQHLSKCTPVHLAKVCVALQAAGQAQDKALLDDFADRAAAIVAAFEPEELATVLGAFVQLHPSALSLGAAAASHTLTSLLPSRGIDTETAVSILSACAMLGVVSPDLARAVEQLAMSGDFTVDTDVLVSLWVSASKMQVQDGRLTEALQDRLSANPASASIDALAELLQGVGARLTAADAAGAQLVLTACGSLQVRSGEIRTEGEMAGVIQGLLMAGAQPATADACTSLLTTLRLHGGGSGGGVEETQVMIEEARAELAGKGAPAP